MRLLPTALVVSSLKFSVPLSFRRRRGQPERQTAFLFASAPPRDKSIPWLGEKKVAGPCPVSLRKSTPDFCQRHRGNEKKKKSLLDVAVSPATDQNP